MGILVYRFVGKQDQHILEADEAFGKFAKSAQLLKVLNVQEGRAALYTTRSTDVSIISRSSQVLDSTHQSLRLLHVTAKSSF